MAPRVSFVVPCYNLAHLLPDCVHSILSQSFRDLEILVMDDRSPDNTPEVAQSFGDERVRWIRNERNLGHIPNFNKGITLCRGEYVWLISADDRLRRDDALERFVAVLDRHPDVGYVFSQGMYLQDGVEDPMMTNHGPVDAVFPGEEFCCRLVRRNGVPTPGVMVRARCYAKYGLWPVDLPYAGDWFLWLKLALHENVGYIAEPMVHYCRHETNMTRAYEERVYALIADEIAVRWRLCAEAAALGKRAVVQACERAIREDYCLRAGLKIRKNWGYGMTVGEVEQSLRLHCRDRALADRLLAAACAAAADEWYDQGRFDQARQLYDKALEACAEGRTTLKRQLLALGPAGRGLRRMLVSGRGAIARKRAPELFQPERQ